MNRPRRRIRLNPGLCVYRTDRRLHRFRTAAAGHVFDVRPMAYPFGWPRASSYAPYHRWKAKGSLSDIMPLTFPLLEPLYEVLTLVLTKKGVSNDRAFK